jgi:hypothetical protein
MAAHVNLLMVILAFVELAKCYYGDLRNALGYHVRLCICHNVR